MKVRKHEMPSQPLLFLSHSGVDTEGARELKRRIEACPSAKQVGLKVSPMQSAGRND
jgi:hypothetical protein